MGLNLRGHEIGEITVQPTGPGLGILKSDMPDRGNRHSTAPPGWVTKWTSADDL